MWKEKCPAREGSGEVGYLGKLSLLKPLPVVAPKPLAQPAQLPMPPKVKERLEQWVSRTSKK